MNPGVNTSGRAEAIEKGSHVACHHYVHQVQTKSVSIIYMMLYNYVYMEQMQILSGGCNSTSSLLKLVKHYER